MDKNVSPIAKDTKKNIDKGKDKHTRLSFSKIILICLLLFIYSAASLAVLLLGTNAWVVSTVKNRINTDTDKKYDAVIILGAGVRSDGSMSDMLRDRMDVGIAAYFEGLSDKILVTGDHGRENYDEVNTMKEYAVECGVPDTDVFMDHAGFSTYESMVRAKKVFEVESAVVVTQEYHLYRAMYIADYIGIECVGLSADLHSYRGQSYRDLREVLARFNDAVRRYTRPEPTYLGEIIPVSGDGNVTNDK